MSSFSLLYLITYLWASVETKTAPQPLLCLVSLQLMQKVIQPWHLRGQQQMALHQPQEHIRMFSSASKQARVVGWCAFFI
ncbi:hypothetical protein FGO68_gene7062 [Halteria grandinella]|uniref:Secreted protein n=1 Tax=Halteria grandinella TaxID=5974 RepID=A0A8J8NMN0_HALGN|nr:hypothetical protein FGO68_gene7062 [Halteria grandinella]